MVGVAVASWWLAGLAMAPLLDAYRRQEQFSADVAHELRTPLANLLALVEAERCANAEVYDSSTANSLDRVLGQGRRLQQLISDLLLLASLERPFLQEQKQVCDLAEIIADVLEDFGEAAASAQVRLEQDQNVPTAQILGIESELSRLVINLLSNAITHTPLGGRIGVALEQSGRQIRLSIRDTGPGIPAVEQQRIFDRFSRLDPARSRQQGGTGLGLAIAQAIAHRHGGEITVQSAPGNGSCFYVVLPVAD
jgi:two-component Ni(II)/redox sensor kinase NrsS